MLLESSRSADSAALGALERFARDHGIVVERTGRAELDRRARGVSHQGAMALARPLVVTDLDETALGAMPLVLALDEVQDPQNFGAIIRSSVAMGATAVVWPEHRSAPLSPATFRASAGAVEHAVLYRVPALPRALERLRAEGLVVVGLDITATLSIDEVDLNRPVSIVIGSEGKGLRKTVKGCCDVLARLPMPGPIEALNASAAAAVALYEAARQRGVRGRSHAGSGADPDADPDAD